MVPVYSMTHLPYYSSQSGQSVYIWKQLLQSTDKLHNRYETCKQKQQEHAGKAPAASNGTRM